jgi:hypothetical protein
MINLHHCILILIRLQVFEQARSVLDVYVSLLHDRTFCLGDK